MLLNIMEDGVSESVKDGLNSVFVHFNITAWLYFQI